MTTQLPEVWTWGESPAAAPPPEGIEVVPMTLGRMSHWSGIDRDERGFATGVDVTSAVLDAESYAFDLIERCGDGPCVPCLQFFADREGEGLARDEFFPYWAAAGAVIARRLASRFRDDRNIRGIVIHAEDRRREDGELDRKLRDVRLEAALIASLARWLPEVPITGYGVIHAPSAFPSMSSYGFRSRVDEAWDSVLPNWRPRIPWIPRPGHVRDSWRYASLPPAAKVVTGLDVAHGYARAADAVSPAVCLWGGHAEDVAGWRDAWSAIGGAVATGEFGGAA